MYIEIRDQWTISQYYRFIIINSDYNNKNTNISIVFSQHPYCCVNKIVLTVFLNESKVDVLVHSTQFVPFAMDRHK